MYFEPLQHCFETIQIWPESDKNTRKRCIINPRNELDFGEKQPLRTQEIIEKQPNRS